MARYLATSLSLFAILTACGGGGGTTAATYSVGGTVNGLAANAQVVLANGADKLTLNAAGAFTFSKSLTSGATFAVTVESQPAGQACSVTNGSGTVSSSNVTSVQVSCVTVYSTGGTVSGLSAGASVTLKRGAEQLSVSSNGNSTFSNAVSTGIRLKL